MVSCGEKGAAKQCREKRKVNILLVISDKLLRGTLAEVLKKRVGYHVVPTETGEGAISWLHTLETDLLVVNLNVESGGAEPIVQAFRAKWEHLPVLLVAGSYSEPDLKRVERMHSACWCTGDFDDFWLAMMRAFRLAPSHGAV